MIKNKINVKWQDSKRQVQTTKIEKKKLKITKDIFVYVTENSSLAWHKKKRRD